MSKLKAYPKYKDSGVEWIGEVPEGWEAKSKLGYLFSVVRGGSPRPIDEFITDAEDGINWIKIGDTKEGEKYIYGTEEKITKEGANFSRLVHEGDFILSNSMSFGRPYIMKTSGCIHDGWLALQSIRNDIDQDFMYLTLSSQAIAIQFFTLVSGTAVKNLNIELARQIRIPLPSLPEQQAITAYLDRETAQIDALITKKTRSIELLREKRQAMITHAVTKGLNPNAKMKNSGVEWIGDVPERWDVAEIRWIYKRAKITNSSSETLLSVYRNYGVIPKSSRDDNRNRESEDLSSYQLVEIGDLVTNKMKAWQGSIAISGYKGIVSPAYYVYKSLHDEWDKYIHYLLRSIPYITYYGIISKGIRVGQWDLEHEAFRLTPVLLPPLPEQQAIASYLDAKCSAIDTLITKTERSIELLREKRQALITAAVTGKIDVREAASEVA